VALNLTGRTTTGLGYQVVTSMQKLRATRPASTPRPARRAAAVPVVSADSFVTIVAVSLKEGTPASRSAGLATALSEAFSTPAVGPRIVLLPGWTTMWPEGDDVVVDLCRKHGASVLFERCLGNTGTWTAFDGSGAPLGVEVNQVLSDSGQADREPETVDALLRDCAPGGRRTVRLGGVDVGLLCCGENNVLKCAQARGNEVSVRHHPKASIFDHVPVVFNGAHTNMGNWNKLKKRFEYLSRDGRIAIFLTNNSRSSWRGSARVYFDGGLLADGEDVVVRDAPVTVRVVRDPDGDRFRALVVTAPGSVLQPR
jgi:hypothetical protein